MGILLERLIKKEDSWGGTFHLMKKISELKEMETLTKKIFAGKEKERQEKKH